MKIDTVILRSMGVLQFVLFFKTVRVGYINGWRSALRIHLGVIVDEDEVQCWGARDLPSSYPQLHPPRPTSLNRRPFPPSLSTIRLLERLGGYAVSFPKAAVGTRNK